LLCVAAVQRINEVFSTVNDEFEEFSYNMKVYRYVTHFLNIRVHIHLINKRCYLVLLHLLSFWDMFWGMLLETGCWIWLLQNVIMLNVEFIHSSCTARGKPSLWENMKPHKLYFPWIIPILRKMKCEIIVLKFLAILHRLLLGIVLFSRLFINILIKKLFTFSHIVNKIYHVYFNNIISIIQLFMFTVLFAKLYREWVCSISRHSDT